MPIIKNRLKSHYTTIPNSLITDMRLSSTEVRIMLYIASKPDNWQVNNSDVMKTMGISRRDTLAKYWKKLEECGYIVRSERHNSGKFQGFDYEVFPEPCTVQPDTVPCTVQPYTVRAVHGTNRTHNKERDLIKKSINKKEVPQEISENFEIHKIVASMRDVLRKGVPDFYGRLESVPGSVDEILTSFAEWWVYDQDREWKFADKGWVKQKSKGVCASFENWIGIAPTKEAGNIEEKSELSDPMYVKVLDRFRKLCPSVTVTDTERVELRKFIAGDGSVFCEADWISHLKDNMSAQNVTVTNLLFIAKNRLKYYGK